jgi:hypothetical protein
MALSMNRYIGNSILPLLITHSKFYNEAENYGSLLDATLHTVYRSVLNFYYRSGSLYVGSFRTDCRRIEC